LYKYAIEIALVNFFLNFLEKTNKQLINCGLQKQQEMGDKAIKIEQQEEEEEAEKQQQEQTPMKATRNIKGQKMDYYFLKTVNSVDELDDFRFKVT
jgi:hypothetical protein